MTPRFELLAQPWWVNLLILIPLTAAYTWRRHGPGLSARQLVAGALFAIGFGFVEAAVVVYLRGAVGMLGGAGAGISEMSQLNAMLSQPAPEMLRLFKIEVAREAATMLMLVSVAVLAASRARERWALFLWCFAIWDLVYYAGLWVTIRWPESLLTQDVLFLIPVPWVSQVWFPCVVSGLTVAVVLVTSTRERPRQS
ncbi:MAG: hypothetical protein LAN37_10910 [Acidobacteriia bacterium]|nr:hypothetical protein [Terriglobia bacterium]